MEKMNILCNAPKYLKKIEQGSREYHLQWKNIQLTEKS